MNRSFAPIAILLSFFFTIFSCYTPQAKIAPMDGDQIIIIHDEPKTNAAADSIKLKNYLKIEAVYSGVVYENGIDKKDVFFRILEIPEEENKTLVAEKIAIGDEGGDYKLIKSIRLTGPHSLLSALGHGLYQIDSLKFIDSVRIIGSFNGKKIKINLDSLQTPRVP